MQEPDIEPPSIADNGASLGKVLVVPFGDVDALFRVLHRKVNFRQFRVFHNPPWNVVLQSADKVYHACNRAASTFEKFRSKCLGRSKNLEAVDRRVLDLKLQALQKFATQARRAAYALESFISEEEKDQLKDLGIRKWENVAITELLTKKDEVQNCVNTLKSVLDDGSYVQRLDYLNYLERLLKKKITLPKSSSTAAPASSSQNAVGSASASNLSQNLPPSTTPCTTGASSSVTNSGSEDDILNGVIGDLLVGMRNLLEQLWAKLPNNGAAIAEYPAWDEIKRRLDVMFKDTTNCVEIVETYRASSYSTNIVVYESEVDKPFSSRIKQLRLEALKAFLDDLRFRFAFPAKEIVNSESVNSTKEADAAWGRTAVTAILVKKKMLEALSQKIKDVMDEKRHSTSFAYMNHLEKLLGKKITQEPPKNAGVEPVASSATTPVAVTVASSTSTPVRSSASTSNKNTNGAPASESSKKSPVVLATPPSKRGGKSSSTSCDSTTVTPSRNSATPTTIASDDSDESDSDTETDTESDSSSSDEVGKARKTKKEADIEFQRACEKIPGTVGMICGFFMGVGFTLFLIFLGMFIAYMWSSAK
ncbi:unnamed protein product [Amoebophrya sp. A120]|nr:unnamed protein product [Amoebophrya sp. A120]|eukprot:GSA120T00012842001.1